MDQEKKGGLKDSSFFHFTWMQDPFIKAVPVGDVAFESHVESLKGFFKKSNPELVKMIEDNNK